MLNKTNTASNREIGGYRIGVGGLANDLVNPENFFQLFLDKDRSFHMHSARINSLHSLDADTCICRGMLITFHHLMISINTTIQPACGYTNMLSLDFFFFAGVIWLFIHSSLQKYSV